ncbi:MAG: glycosyltransferase family 39 protein, partial [Candidatus Roizmanbacteria bacterium]|nr:glycosyltransferase family 39 protein [Candidatus Roizmanbacteria bacterium]
LWLYLNQKPPAWDQAFHLKSAFATYHWLHGQKPVHGIDIIRSFYVYPPLQYVITALWMSIVGTSITTATVLNSLYFCATMVVVGLITYEITKKVTTSVIAALIYTLTPLNYDTSRNFLLEPSLLLLISLALYFYIRSHNFTQTKQTVLFFITFIIASYIKLNAFMYFAPIFLWSAATALQYKHKKPVLVLVAFGLGYALCMSPWWWANRFNLDHYLHSPALRGELATDPMNIMSLYTWGFYFKIFFLHQFFPIPALLFLISFIPVLREYKKQHVLFMLLYLLSVYAIGTLVTNKDPRYTMPLLISVAVLAGINFSSWPRKMVGLTLAGVLIVFLFSNYINNSYNWPLKKNVSVTTTNVPFFEDVEWIGIDDYPVRRYVRGNYPQKTVIADLANISQHNLLKVVVLVNTEGFNDNNLMLYQEIQRAYSLEFHSIGLRESFESTDEIRDLLAHYPYLLIADPDYESVPFYAINYQAFKQIQAYVQKQVEQELMCVIQEYPLEQHNVYLIDTNGVSCGIVTK